MKAPGRRRFLRRSAAAGSGLLLAVYVPELAADDAAPAAGPSLFEPNAYLSIAPDESVTVFVVRHEMGQGVRTLLPMMVAEELEADLARIRLEQAVTGPRFAGIRLHTSGSGSSRGTYEALRKAGAAAREMLVAAAAERWGVAAEGCLAESGSVTHGPSGRRLSYGQLAAAAAKQPVPPEPRLKDPSRFRLLGRPMKRVDGPEIVSGRARYGIDVRIPGMLFASVERAPVLGAKLVRFDASRALARPGVRHVVPVRSGIQQGVAVVADHTWAAMAAREALDVQWDLGAQQEFDSERFIAELPRRLEEDARFLVRQEGDAPAALETAASRHAAVYVFPFQAHAALETMNCTADVRSDAAEFWAPTQTQHRCMQQAIKLTGLPAEKIRIHATLMGGGFGRRLFADYLAEAAEISKAITRPVQVVWTREDDTRHGYFQPCTAERLEGGLDAEGRLVGLLHRSTVSDLTIYDIHDGRDIYGGVPAEPKKADHYSADEYPWGSYDNPYDLPLRVEAVDVRTPVPHGPWRAVMYPSTVFGRESFLDEMAHLASMDPLAFRLALVGEGARKIGSFPLDRRRLARVHQLAAERAGWTRPLPADGRLRGRGIAASVYHGGSYVAQVAEVSLAKDLSDLRVERITCAIDCGLALNPLGVSGQAESGIVWGLSYTLYGKVDFVKGRAVQRGYQDFRVLAMDAMPALDIHVIPSQERPGGFGEHPVPMVAPAVANAVFAATGIRLRRLPITPEALQAASKR
ncbi:MAG: molybdopterin cofactor-binding domain-containing protein [Vicinamibacteria bacterium]